MTLRLVAMLLIAVLVGVAETGLPCPQYQCPKGHATACCQDHGLAKPSCCPPLQRVGARATSPAAEQAANSVIHLASGFPSPFAPVPCLSLLAAPRPTGRCATALGTLWSQRTSLVL